MNFDKVIEEIKKEGEEELKKLKKESDEYTEKINIELNKELKNIEKKWNELIEKEKKSLIEKKENELKLELDLVELKRKNQILNELFNNISSKLNDLSNNDKKKFFFKEILKAIETGNEVIHFDKNSLKIIFDESFKKDIIQNVEKNLGKSKIKFIEDNETFIEGEGFISRITLKDKFKEIWDKEVLEISKRIFEEDET